MPKEIVFRSQSQCFTPTVTTKGYLMNQFDVEAAQEAQVFKPIDDNALKHCPSKKKTGFFKSLFCKKKCQLCSHKKNRCTCNTNKKNSQLHNDFRIKGNCPEATPLTATNCGVQRKCTCPVDQKGCGCNFYFCVHVKNNIKRKKNRKSVERDNKKIITNRRPTNLIESLVNCNTYCNGMPKVTIICQDSKAKLKDMPKEAITNTVKGTTITKDAYQTTNDELVSVNAYQYPYRQSEDSDVVYYTGRINQNLLTLCGPNNINKNKFKAVDGNTGFKFNPKTTYEYTNNGSKSNHITNYNNRLKVRNTEQENMINKNLYKGNKKENSGLNNSPDETIVLPVKYDNNTFNFTPKRNSLRTKVSFANMVPPSAEVNTSDAEEAIVKEYEAYQNRGTKRRSMASKSVKSRRKSVLEGRVSLILMKLAKIENKITGIKVNCRNKNNDITISCDNKRSTVALSFNNESGGQTHQPAKKININPMSSYLDNCVKIKRHNENVFLNAPGHITVVKERNPSLDDTTTKFVPQNMLLNTADNNFYPRNFICNVASQLSKQPTICDKWDRVSEELKICQQDQRQKSISNCSYKIVKDEKNCVKIKMIP